MTVLKDIKPGAEMENDGEEATGLDTMVREGLLEFPEEWTSVLKPDRAVPIRRAILCVALEAGKRVACFRS